MNVSVRYGVPGRTALRRSMSRRRFDFFQDRWRHAMAATAQGQLVYYQRAFLSVSRVLGNATVLAGLAMTPAPGHRAPNFSRSRSTAAPDSQLPPLGGRTAMVIYAPVRQARLRGHTVMRADLNSVRVKFPRPAQPAKTSHCTTTCKAVIFFRLRRWRIRDRT